MKIQDKIIIITGASMGIGAAAARELTNRGAKVVLAARSKDKLQALEKELPSSFAIVTDMTDAASIKHMIDETVKKFGRIDVLINNAGQGMYGTVEKTNIQDYRQIIGLNIMGPLIAM